MNIRHVKHWLIAQSLRRLLALYVVFSASVIILFSLLFCFQLGSIGYDKTEHLHFLDYVYFSSMTWFTVGFGDLHPKTDYAKSLAISESLLAPISNGALIAIIVYKLLRLEGPLFIITRRVAFARHKQSGHKRLELRICNDAPYPMVNLSAKLYLRHFSPSFPETPYSTMWNVILNRSDYPYLESKDYYIVSTAVDAHPTEPRDLLITDDFLSRFNEFTLILLIEGRYLNSGLPYFQSQLYARADIQEGHFFFSKKEDLLENARLRVDRFNEISER